MVDGRSGALPLACTGLSDAAAVGVVQSEALEQEAFPALDELTSKISTLNLERVRRLKSRLMALTVRVQKVSRPLPPQLRIGPGILMTACLLLSWAVAGSFGWGGVLRAVAVVCVDGVAGVADAGRGGAAAGRR
jgi:hypothetical protein